MSYLVQRRGLKITTLKSSFCFYRWRKTKRFSFFFVLMFHSFFFCHFFTFNFILSSWVDAILHWNNIYLLKKWSVSLFGEGSGLAVKKEKKNLSQSCTWVRYYPECEGKGKGYWWEKEKSGAYNKIWNFPPRQQGILSHFLPSEECMAWVDFLGYRTKGRDPGQTNYRDCVIISQSDFLFE